MPETSLIHARAPRPPHLRDADGGEGQTPAPAVWASVSPVAFVGALPPEKEVQLVSIREGLIYRFTSFAEPHHEEHGYIFSQTNLTESIT